MNSATPTSRRGLAGWVAAVAGLLVAGKSAAAQPAPAGPSPASPARLSADDRLEIIELMARYAWAYDTEDAAALATTFTPTAMLEIFGAIRVEIPADLPGFMAQARTMKGEHGWQHLVNHHLFRDYDGQHCTVYSYYLMPESDRQGGEARVRAMGYYVSHCIRTPDGWRFSRRDVVRWTGKAPVVL